MARKPQRPSRELLEALYLGEGRTLDEIAQLLGYRDKAGVHYWIRKYGIKKPTLRPSKERLVELYIEQGLSTLDIAERIGVKHQSTVCNWLEEYGVPRRKGFKRLSQKSVENFFEEHGAELLSTYKNTHTRLRYRCSCGRLASTSFASFRRYGRCRQCGRESQAATRRHSQESVEFLFSEQGCELLSTYRNMQAPVRYRCVCGNISWIRVTNFVKGNRCIECKRERFRGENNPNYNPDLSDEERKDEREYEGYKRWRSGVFRRDGYACRACGDNTSGNLVAHHLEGYDNHPELRTDVNNGICLCRECHDNFHQTYGYGGNTAEQFWEFKEKTLQRTS